MPEADTVLEADSNENRHQDVPHFGCAFFRPSPIMVSGVAGANDAALVQFMTATKFKFGIFCALVLGGAATFVVQHHASVQLRAVSAQVNDQAKEIVRLHEENDQLRRTVAANAPNPVRRPAVASASAGAGAPRHGPTVPLAAGLIPITSLKDAGRATARAAFQTQLWAAHSGDVDLTARAITFGPEARAKLEALLAQLPQDFRDSYGTPEKLMAFVLAGSPHPVGGMQILGEDQIDANDVVLHTQWQHEDDTIVHNTDSQFQQSADGWRLVVPMILVDRASAYLLRTAQ
jgi:hypothetical protein